MVKKWEKVHWQEAIERLSLGQPVKRIFEGREAIYKNGDIFNETLFIRIVDKKTTLGDWFVEVR